MLRGGSLTLAQVRAQIFTAAGLAMAEAADATAQSALLGIGVSFVNGGAAQTVAQLMANYPAGATYSGLYARVSDLYSNGIGGEGVDEILRCRHDATNGLYRWQPQRADFNAPMSPTGGTVNLTPLVTPPTVRLTGTLLGNLTVTPSSTNAYVGQRFRVIQNSTLGIFATTLTGLIGLNLTLLGNTATELEYMAAGWAKASS